MTVTEDCIDRMTSLDNKKPPSTAEIEKTHFSVSGRWTSEIQIDDKPVLNFKENLPYEMQAYPHPIPSNSTYREDLIYRQKLEIARSQI